MSAGLPTIDLNQITDPLVREGMVLLMNLVEELSAENQRLRAEVQRLRDEVESLEGGAREAGHETEQEGDSGGTFE